MRVQVIQMVKKKKKSDIHINFLINKGLLLQRGGKALEEQRAQGTRDTEFPKKGYLDDLWEHLPLKHLQ